MISFQRYGRRMIGASSAERLAHVRARYLGDPLLHLGPGNVATSAPAFVGEGSAPAPKKVIALHLGPPPAPAPAAPKKLITLHLGPSAPSAPVVDTLPAATFIDTTTDAAAAPVYAPAPAASAPCSCMKASVGGALAGVLLGYVVGLVTREHKPKRRRR